MHVFRGRAGDVAADRSVTRRLVERAVGGEPGVRVWRPHRQLAFGPRDRRCDGYERAREIAADRGFEPTERAVGGRAVAFTGRTVAFARVEPIEEGRRSLDERYAEARVDLREALARLGVDAERGEPDHSFCPGTQSLQVDGRKVAGLAQRVERHTATVAGIVVVAEHEAIADVLEPVYDALDLDFDPETVGSVERAGGTADPVSVIQAIEDALVGDHLGTVEWVGE
ncbi:MAG: lipoate--protein ligase family protein [Haloarculaceae archaeon]